MKFEFLLNIDCGFADDADAPERCSKYIQDQVLSDLGVDLGVGNHGHIWVSHAENNHKVMIFVYDEEGKGEHSRIRWELKNPTKNYDAEIPVKDGKGKTVRTLGGTRQDYKVDDPLAHKSPVTVNDIQVRTSIQTAILKGVTDGHILQGRGNLFL